MFSASKQSNRAARTFVLSMIAMTAACGDAPEVEISDPDQYLDELPAYPEPAEAYDRATEGAKFEHTGDAVCSTTTYEISDAPEDVVMFNTDPQVFWPGALIQGDSYESGSPLLIPLANRAPVNISVQGLYADRASAFDVTPTQSEVTQAVSSLLAGAVRSDTPATQSVFFNQKEAYSFEQSALKLGFSARYLGARVRGSLNYKTNSEQHTVVANATIRTFTVSVDQPPTPSSFFEGLSAEELSEQVELGRLSENNLPVYVASVTYGQIMMFSATSTASMSQLKGALSASFSSFAGGGSASVSAEQQQVLQDSEITVITLGGSEQGVAEMIKNGNPQDFFNGTTVVTSSVPIAYTLKDLQGNVVKVGESSEYDLTTCQANGFANFYVTNHQQGTRTVAGYYADGTEAELASEMNGSGPLMGIAYDSLDDDLYLLSAGSGQSTVDIYEANGVQPELSHWHVERDTSSITYDPNHARLYLTGDFGPGQILAAYNPNGDPLGIPFYSELADPASYNEPVFVYPYAAAYDATRDRIYVSILVTGVCELEDCRNTFQLATVLAFDFQGNEIELEGGFEGLVGPQGIAYDASLDRIYVSDAFEDAVRVFDAEGRTIQLPNPIENLSRPLGLHFDSTYNRLYVVNQGSSVITVYEPDGSPAQGLAVPAFPKLNAPTAIAFRPF
jgi:sugar lactone lactonase YvrE